MSKKKLPYNYICIEGNIGAGKTTLCHKIEQVYEVQLVLEQFSENPFLPFFYNDPKRYAFSVELFFMTERQKQLQKHLLNRSLFEETILADYHFIKTALFARKNLDADEYRLFMRLFKILNASFPKPDMIVYLHRSIDSLLEYIQVRGRSFEYSISAEYLQNIQDTYFDYFRSEDAFPILIIDCEFIDFESNPKHFSDIMELIRQDYQPGVHRISLLHS